MAIRTRPGPGDSLRRHRGGRRTHDQPRGLRRHRARGGAAAPVRGPGRARRSHSRGQLHAACADQERARRPAAVPARLQGEPGVRRGRDRATDLRLRPSAHRHHRVAPTAQRRPRPPGTGAVAHRGAAAASAAGDVGRQPDLRRAERGLLRAPGREPRVHGDPLHGCRHGRGVLADPAPVGQVDQLRVPRPHPGVLRVAGAAGLDRRLRTAPGQPAADRAQRPRQAMGAEEPVPPRGAGRAHVGLPGRADRADPP